MSLIRLTLRALAGCRPSSAPSPLFLFVVVGWTTTFSPPGLAQECVDPPAGLVAWWTGDVDATDSQGANDGMLIGDATAGAPGLVDGAFGLDGAGDRIIASDPNVNLHNLTVAAWIYPDVVCCNNQRIVTKFPGTGSPAGSWVFDFFTDGGLRFLFGI